MLIGELQNISKDLPFFQAYERAVWGKSFEEERGRQVILQLLREIELPKVLFYFLLIKRINFKRQKDYHKLLNHF
jgi:hypothetical protein